MLGGLGVAVIGRRDLPRGFRMVGTQVGRIVGMLQGARVRADRFTAQNELRQLQNELRSGLRELDSVRSELAVSMSASGMVGKGLGTTVRGANRTATTPATTMGDSLSSSSSTTAVSGIQASSVQGVPSIGGGEAGDLSSSVVSSSSSDDTSQLLAPRSHSIAAVAEEEWQKQGIGFRSQAERGNGEASGSALLSDLLQQTLIHDQHDRAVQEQEEAVQSRMMQRRRKDKTKQK